MALMKFREQNHVKRIGVRPGHDGTQIYKYKNVNVIGFTELLGASATLTRYITYFFLTLPANAAQSAEIVLRDDTPNIKWRLVRGRGAVGYKGDALIGNFWPPLEVPPTYTIDLSLTAAVFANCGLLGWEE